MNSYNDSDIQQAIEQILSELREDPRFTIEDEAAAIKEKVFKPYQRFLLATFNISLDAYERTKV